MFIKYSTSEITPKKSRGNGSQGKKTIDVYQEPVDVSKEFEPEPAKRKTTSKRVVKKKVAISTDDNIIPDLDIALELGVLDESTVISATSSEETESEYSKEDLSEEEEIDWIGSEEDDEKKDDTDDDKSIDLEISDNEETDDEILQGKEQVNNDEDEEMTNVQVEESRNGDEEDTEAAKADSKKTEEVKDDSKKPEVPLTRSSLYVSLEAEINSLLDIKIQYQVPHIQSPSVLKVLVFVISKPPVLTPVQETPSATHVTTLPHPSVSTIPPAPLQQSIGPIHSPPITTDAPTITIVVPESSTTPTINLEQESEKTASNILKITKEQAKKQKMPKYTIKSIEKATLKECDQKNALYQTMDEIKYFNRNHANHRLYHPLMEALIEDEKAMDKGVADIVKDHKRKHDDDNDDPPARPNQGKKTKRRRTKESKSSKKPSTTKETPKGKASSKSYKTDKLDWNNPEGDQYPFDLSKPLPLQGRPGHLTVVVDHIFNNDLEYLKYFDPKRTYTTSITKTKAARYEIVRIKDMVATLWSIVKHMYDKDDAKGIKHWGKMRKLWYRSQMNKFSKQNVYFTQKILGVKNVSVKKLHGYGHLEQVMVKRADRHLYKFKEGNFVDLHLNDIKDMPILVVKHKLFHLNDNDIVDFIMVLCMFARSLIIKHQVEDL
nr:hypothetical protein [Tanacetum cinerariifolium]